MRYKIVAVRDRAADVFGVPSFVLSTGAAIRSFSDEINRQVEKGVLAEHPDDFDMYELGEFDDSDGLFYAGSPRQIAIGKDLVRAS